MQALGLIETRGTLAAIEAADAMMKAADVSLLQKVRIGGGLVTIAVTGDVAEVKASVVAGCASVERLSQSSLYGSHVIPRPHEEVESLFRPEPPNKKGHRDCETKPETEEARVEETENTESEVPTIEEADLEESVANQPEEAERINAATQPGETVNEPEPESTAAAEPEEIMADGSEAVRSQDGETEMEETAVGENACFGEKLTKEFLETVIQEQGKRKAMELLEAQKVTELRALARELKGFRISGRRISKANKHQLMEELRYYFNRPETETEQ